MLKLIFYLLFCSYKKIFQSTPMRGLFCPIYLITNRFIKAFKKKEYYKLLYLK